MNSALTPGGVLYIAGQPRYNHTGQVIIYKMEGKEVQVIQRLNGEQVSMHTQLTYKRNIAGEISISNENSLEEHMRLEVVSKVRKKS